MLMLDDADAAACLLLLMSFAADDVCHYAMLPPLPSTLLFCHYFDDVAMPLCCLMPADDDIR